MPLLFAILCFVFLFPSCAAAEEPTLGPAIEDYGPTFAVADRDVPVVEDTVYRTVFDAASHPDDMTALNNKLVSVARFLNMHARSGTPLEHMEIAVVVHGRALASVLSNAAYEARHGVGNPNLELVQKLADAGVEFYVCGQSLGFRGIGKSELVDQASVALSAMTMLTELQNQGYALIT